MNQPIFTIEHLDKSPEQVKIPGYFIASTAPINIEGKSPRSSERNPANERTSVDLDELVELIFSVPLSVGSKKLIYLVTKRI